ncbi:MULTISPECIES: non-ribosomal peptide synthetase [unclassified Micromonospora]|uniref:non-ribosomal peptide synthetase n=1 Tax=unclassified Micromonospora TaxID=2617518 RepID=UPI0009CA7DF5|nr:MULTISPECIES: non-ribosomal peptide synthetase [unclassified Micromonospora]OON32455.1 hypothetical protein BSA16_05420 [Micromonospora sp. Rc5]
MRGRGTPAGLHETVAWWALTRPDAPAVVSAEGHPTTYRELDRAAHAWAADLAAAGVGPGVRVPVLLPRGAPLVTAIVAVLKTGAAYSLLDRDWPAERLREVVALLHPTLIAAAGDPAAAALGVPTWTVLRGPIPAADGFRPAEVGGEAPCCVFFTSGSTGQPKGVLAPHRAVARLFRPGTFAEFSTDTVIPLAAALPWDAFCLELWAALLNGGTAVVVSEPYLSVQALRRAIEAHGANTAWFTSSLFNLIVDEDVAAFAGLRQVMTGGERLSPPHVRRFLVRHPSVVLLNGYGPVESTVFATTHRITAADCDRPDGIPIGRPVPGTAVSVLDGDRPCDVGDVGEICLSGDGLALGYLDDPEATLARFPHVSVGGARVRVYRTGDLGEFDADGVLHFRGRLDRQVKVRGHRVEPAEVERRIERLLPGVRHCRVVARQAAQGTERELVAFCVPARAGDPLAGALDVLRRTLAPQHRPAAVLPVDRFPVTAHGKLDERALLAVALDAADRHDAPPGDQAAAPRPPADDPVVREVAETFAAVLGRVGVPVDVPFAELGGSSLAAGRVCARLSTALGRPVPVSWLHPSPSAARLAERLRAGPSPAAPASVAGTADENGVPLTAMQLVHLMRDLIDDADRTNLCLLFWVVEGDLNPGALDAAAAAVHDRHEALRAVYDLDSRLAIVPADVPSPPLEVLPAAQSTEAAIRFLRDEFGSALAPQDGDVWRVGVVPVTDTLAVIGCVVHHVAFDGWSEAVLARDLGRAYRVALGYGGGSGEGTAPPSLREIHRERVRRTAVTAARDHHDHLTAELLGAPPVNWPAVPRPPDGARVAHLTGVLGWRELAELDAVAAQVGATRFAALMARCGRAISEATGQPDVTVGVPVAQRDVPGLDLAVGCHLTMVCVRLRGAALDGTTEAVRATGHVVDRALAAQDVPFDELVRFARHRGDRSPLFQVLVAMQDNTTPELTLPGARTTFVRQPYLDLPLDLHVEMWPAGDDGMPVVVSYRPAAVPAHIGLDVLAALTGRPGRTGDGGDVR